MEKTRYFDWKKWKRVRGHCNATHRSHRGRDPFNQTFRKFRSKTQWIGSAQPEKFRKNGSTFWGGPLFPVGPVGISVEWIAPRVTFHFPRVKAMWSRFSNQRMETSLSLSSLLVHITYGGWWAIEGDSTPCSFVYSEGKHTFLEGKALKNTWPFMRLIEVKERPKVFEEQARIQSSESDAREEEVLAWKHDVSFSRLATYYCIFLYYNCKLKWACFLVFIFYFYSSLIYIYLACESIRFIRGNERKYHIYSINRPGPSRSKYG